MSFWKQVSVLAGGTAAAHAVTLAALPVITRLFGPDEYGIFVVLMAILAMWSTLLTLRYESAVFVADSEMDIRALLTLCRMLTVAMSLLALPVLIGLITFDVARLASLQWTAVVASVLFLIGTGLFQTRRAFDVRSARLKPVRTATVGRSAGSAATKIATGLLGAGSTGLIAGETVGAWLGVWLLGRRQGRFPKASVSRSQLTSVAAKYPKFPKLELPSTLIDSASALIVLPLFAQIFGLKEAAFLGLAQRVVALPNTHIGRAIGDITQLEIGEKYRQRQAAEIESMLRALVRRLAMIGLLPLIAIVTLAPFVFGLVFGADWRQSGVVAAVIAPWLYAAFVVSTVSRVLLVVQKQEFKLAYDVAAVLLVFGVFLATLALQLSFLQSVALLSAGRVLTYTLYLFVIFRAVRSTCVSEAPT